MNISITPVNKLICITLITLSSSFFSLPVMAETVRVPVKLDYPLLQQLMVMQLFKTADQKVEILHDTSGCNKIFLSDPQLREVNQKLQISTHVKANIATPLFGNCAPLFNWEGGAQFVTDPIIVKGGRSIRLNILETRLFDTQGQLVTGQIWALASKHLQPLMSRYQIDLSPTIQKLGTLLPAVLNKRSTTQISKIIDSLGLASLSVAADGIDASLKLQIDKLPTTTQPAKIYTSKEIKQLESKWQMMDAMITFAVKRYAKATHQQNLRDSLAEILLDARYRLTDALEMPVSDSNDPVRHWFIDSWQRLGPVLRQVSLENPGQEPMLLISLLTATDALKTLDELGPAIGVDISANGLRHMGRMLINQPGINPLQYDDAVDEELRQLFQLPVTSAASRSSWFRINLWPLQSALAKSIHDRLHLWVPGKSELPEYLPVIRDLLRDQASSTAEQSGVEMSVKTIFHHLVLATAWQESCWRQFEVNNRKIVTLRSSSGDSGLMQLNEKVWRGLYDTHKLRWNTSYNVRAGVEVLNRYLLKYALKRGEQNHPGGLDNLARSSYSAYNGGPSQTSRYRNPGAPAAFRKVDAAFWNKYQAVKQGKEFQVSECLGVKFPKILASIDNKPAPKTTRIAADKLQSISATGSNDKQAWFMAQNSNYYTLQLATFSSYKAAQKFISDNHLSGSFIITTLGRDKKSQFVVLKDSFEKKSKAEKLKQRYQKLKPWVRQFKDIRASIK